MTYEINPTHHHMIPVGRLCGEAADKIVDLADELARVTKERDEARASADELRRAIADLIGADPETWPDHGNAPLAIAASFALEQNRAEQAEAREAALREALAAETERCAQVALSYWEYHKKAYLHHIGHWQAAADYHLQLQAAGSQIADRIRARTALGGE